MPRRPPTRDYYEEDEIYEMERERDRDRERRPRRRDREVEEDVEYRRRRSEPLAEDMERMHLRERPRRDFMEESFEPPREKDEVILRRSREEVDMASPERPMPLDREEAYMRPPGSRRRPRPREIDDEFVVEERETRRGSRRHPREIDEDLIVEERKHRPEREIEEDLFDEGDRPRERRHRPRRESEEEIIRERERGGDRMRRSVPDLEEEDLMVERERHRRSRRRPRGIEEDELVEERDVRRESRRRPERRSEDDLLIEERERRRSRRHPERRSEDDLLFEERERRQRKRHPVREIEEDLIIEQPRNHGRRRRPRNDFEEEEVLIRRREKDLPLHRHERSLDFEEEERFIRPRARSPPTRSVEVEEVIFDEGLPDRTRGPVDRPEQDLEEDEVIFQRKSKGPRSVAPEEEELVLRERHERRERRRSPPLEDPERNMRGLRRGARPGLRPDDEVGKHSRPRDFEENEEEILIRKTMDTLPPRPPSPSMQSIHVPPIHQDVFTHHRHIDHGYEDAHLPRVPTPERRSRRGSIDEIDIHHRSKRGGRLSEEDIILKRQSSEDSLAPEDSISPTSLTRPDFSDPWEQRTSKSRHRSELLDDEMESSFTRSRKAEHPVRDLEDMDIETIRALNRASKGTDDWSVVHAPSKEDTIEMSGALNVVEVEPRHAPKDAVEMGRIAQQVTDSKDPRDDRWTEIAKKLVVKDAIEQLGYEYEETRTAYYIFSYLKPEAIDELVELSDEIRSARRRRIRDMQRERESLVPPAPRIRPPRMGMPPRARMLEKRMQDIRDREWMYDSRR